MHLDAILPYDFDLKDIAAAAAHADDLGIATLWSAETQHDPFLPGPLVYEHSKKLGFGTAIAVSFARSPTTLAYTAWDLARLSGGRFLLGLGTQVKPHIERRFGMPWPDSPVGKLREQITAIRAIWHSWQTGERLNHRGEYYKLTLMSPFFDPGPIEHPDIPIYIAGVNTGLAGLAGETADGFHVHPLHTPAYLEQVIRPTIAAGAAAHGRDAPACKVSVTAFVITNAEEREYVRGQVAFYASTPSYRAVLALHGWAETGEALAGYARRKEWAAMPELIDDTMLAQFAVTASEDTLPAALAARYAGLADRVSLYAPFRAGERTDFWANLASHFQRN